MDKHSRVGRAATTLFPAVFSVTLCIGQSLAPRADPAKGFDPDAATERQATSVSATAPITFTRVIQAASVILLPQHGNVNGGTDRGYSNVGIVFGARIYGGNLANAIELFYYIPSNSDKFYREGDFRAATGRIGSNGGSDLGGYYCPEGYAAVGVQGASGLGVDRVGLICGKIGNPARVVALPVLGGKGGNAFREVCDRTESSGYLTGVRVRSGAWMDSIQGLCQARE
jgi:hypothetical protein